MGRRPAHVQLTEKDRTVLEALLRSGKTEARIHLRARIVLLAADGLGNNEIAEELGIHITTASDWRNRFNRRGLEGLKDDPRTGRPRTITPEVERRVVKATLTPPKTRTHWSQRSMGKHLGISDSTVRTVWGRHDLKPHVVRKFKLSNDPLFEEKVEDIVGLYLNPPDNAVVLAADEKSQIQALDRTRPILPIRPGLPEHQTHDYKRHGTTTLFAALNVKTGEVVHQFHQRHRAEEFIQFLKAVDAATPKRKELHVIVDNYSTHKTPEVKAWLGQNSRFHMHFTPTSSSWINLVERLFGKLTDERIRRGAFKSVPQLEAAIEEWLRAHNDDPKPFKWTKSAKEIIDKANKYRQTFAALH